MSTKRFVHLHNHSHFSLLDASSKIKDTVRRVKLLGQDAIALTDHGNISGAVQLWKACRDEGIKPIVGCEVYISIDDMTVKKVERGQRHYYHFILLAMNKVGYKNLCKIVSAGYTQGFYRRPRVDKKFIAAHSEGLFATSACIGSEIAQTLLLAPNDEMAVALATPIAQEFQEIFDGRFRLELQDHGIPEQRIINERMVRLAKEVGIPLVLTNDCHFLTREDFEPHKALVCIGSREKFHTIAHVYNPNHALKSAEEMSLIPTQYPREIRQDIIDAAAETVNIADQIDFSFESNVYHFPKYTRDDMDQPVRETFRDKVYQGFSARSHLFDDQRLPEYSRRLIEELALIGKMGFESYFLLIADVIDFARGNNIPVGPGRGSVGGSLVSYCLGITTIDPIKHGLLFERFLNPERITMPDIDIDFGKRDREKVMEYVVDKYGRDNVAQIITFGSLKPKAVVNDLGRVLDYPLAETRALANMIPDTPNKPMKLSEALTEVKPLKKFYSAQPDNVKRILDFGIKLEETNRHAGTHAAGVVITPEPITEYAPLWYMPKHKTIAVGYDMKDLEEIGLVKMDFLGLKTLDVIADTLELINEQGVQISHKALEHDFDDRDVYKYIFATGNTAGVFQFESTGMRMALRALGPTCFDDIVAMNALYRPGPNDCLAEGTIVARRRERRPNGLFSYKYVRIEDILEEYQKFEANKHKGDRKLGIISLDEGMGSLIKNKINGVAYKGKQHVKRLTVQTAWTTSSKLTIDATVNHRFLTQDGWKKLGELKLGDYVAIANKGSGAPRPRKNSKYIAGKKNFRNICYYHYRYHCIFCDWSKGSLDVNHLDGNRFTNNNPDNLCFMCPNHHREYSEGRIAIENVLAARKKYRLPFTEDYRFAEIVGFADVGTVKTYDIEVESPNNNFIANNFVVHNSGMTASFIKRKAGKEEVKSIHPALDEILKPTYGVVVFQEQVMHAVQKLTGYSLGQADVIRKAMGKKDPELMKKELKKFIEAGVANGYPRPEMQEISDMISKFARYGFNKAHATVYSAIAYYTAWLKYYYPLEFMTALLNSEAEDRKLDNVHEYISSAKNRHQFEILPPDVNYSGVHFTIEDDNGNGKAKAIRFGLGAISYVGEAVAMHVEETRDAGGQFLSFPDFLNRTNLSTKAIQALVEAGATESLGGHRAQHAASYPAILARKRKNKVPTAQDNIFSRLKPDEFVAVMDEDLLNVPRWDPVTQATQEFKSIGIWLNDHPMDTIEIDKPQNHMDILDLNGILNNDDPLDGAISVQVTGVVTNVTKKRTRRDVGLNIVKLEDQTGRIEIICWDNKLIDSSGNSIDLGFGDIIEIAGAVQYDKSETKRLRVAGISLIKRWADEANIDNEHSDGSGLDDNLF